MRLLGAAAIIEAALLLITGVSLGDSETLAFGVVVAATTAWFIWRRGRIPVLIRSLVFLDVLVFMATAVVANVSSRESLGAVALPLGLAVTSAVGLVATAGYLFGGSASAAAQKGPGLVVIAAVVVCVAVGVIDVSGGSAGLQQGTSDLQLSVHNARFSNTVLSAPSGQVAIYATNNDLFWHTVTIDQLGVDVRIPAKGHRRIPLRAPRGSYTFYCAIPGHAGIGMKGTLTVR